MRVRVKDVLGMLASGANEQEILEAYPYLEREDIRACLEYAAAQVNHAVVEAREVFEQISGFRLANGGSIGCRTGNNAQ
jgi:hypothetical protein